MKVAFIIHTIDVDWGYECESKQDVMDINCVADRVRPICTSLAVYRRDVCDAV
ncbi:hypothetical protein D3C71_1949970 [compost metagenome]